MLHYQEVQKYIIHEEIYKIEMCSQVARGPREPNRSKTGRKNYGVIKLPLHSDLLQSSHRDPGSRIWTWESRVVSNPSEYKNKARWRA